MANQNSMVVKHAMPLPFGYLDWQDLKMTKIFVIKIH